MGIALCSLCTPLSTLWALIKQKHKGNYAGIEDYVADPKNLRICPIELAVAPDPGGGYLWRLSYS